MDTKKHIIVTGATSGIGAVTAKELAKEGNKIVIIGRNIGKCQDTVSQIKQETGQDVEYLIADFSSLNSTRQAARAYLAKYDRLDVLVNNAGALFSKREESNGIEMHVVVNHLAPYVLTQELLGLLQKTAEQTGQTSRIVNVSSDAHFSGIQWDDLQFKNSYPRMGATAYGQSKAMNVLFTLEQARRLEGSGVTINALHPGVINTGIFHSLGGPVLKKIISFINRLSLKAPEEGALTTLHLAQSPEVEGVNGKYYSVMKEKRPLRELRDEAVWAKMWDLTEEWAAIA